MISPRELLSWLEHLPADSALMRALNPDIAWGLPEQLLAGVVDVLTWANYQRAGGKGPKPKPVPRPGVKANTRRYGRTSLPPVEARRILDAYRRGDYATEGDGGGD